MTRVEEDQPSTAGIMAAVPPKEDSDKPIRPVRNRRYTRRSFAAGHRPQKRLFTPEIKRYLKDWLVRRRDNPYPNRDEKKHLAQGTGLTYIQICNWFANWRRKLKNVNENRNQQTWGHLIRTYNDKAQGNVEQFSISSDDSIWSEPDRASLDALDVDEHESDFSTKSKDNIEEIDNNNTYTVTSADRAREMTDENQESSPLLLSKWLESAARFQPSETNYSWWGDGRRKPMSKTQKSAVISSWSRQHGRDEVEAAVALTALATASGTALTAP